MNILNFLFLFGYGFKLADIDARALRLGSVSLAS
jgi:hypothetical protein